LDFSKDLRDRDHENETTMTEADVETTSATQPPPENVSGECANCGKPAETKCSRCKQTFYCRRECQLRDWKRGGHKEICEILQGKVQPFVEVKESRLHGKGLFATKNIPKGTRIAFFKGDLQDSKTTVKMRKNVDGTLGIKEATSYFRNYVTPDPLYDRVMAHPKKEGFMVVASVDQSESESSFGVGQYVNDGACPLRLTKPGLDFADASKALSEYQAESLESMNCEVDKNLWFMTTKDVKSGDELLTHYGFEFWVHRPLVVRQEESGGLCPETLLLLYSLHEQSSKPFNLRQFFDYDSETVAAFLTEYCRVPSDVVSSYKSPKNLVFQLMEKVKMMDPGAAELAASTPDS